MPGEHNFEHLPLVLRDRGRAKLQGGGKPAPQTIVNKSARQAHSTTLTTAAQNLKNNWQTVKADSAERGVPIIPQGVPLLLKVDPGLDLDVLRDKFEFEIVAEQEEGYVIVAAEDIELKLFLQMVNAFAVQVHGSAKIAEVHRLFDDRPTGSVASSRTGSWRYGGRSRTSKSSSSMLASHAPAPRRYRSFDPGGSG